MQQINKLLINKRNSNKTYMFFYEITMAILAIIAVIMVSIEYISHPTTYEVSVFSIIDTVILIIFAIDYFSRLLISQNKIEFFKHNLIDLISIIPFNNIFQAARVLRLTRLLRFTRLLKLTKLLRVISLLARFKKNVDKFVKTNNFHYVLWITCGTVFMGALGLSFTENKSFADSLWWSFVTVTTVGYGDISPATNMGRIIASILMLIGIGFIGMLTGTISTFFIKKKNDKFTYKEKVIEDIKCQLDDFEDLSINDIDDIYNVLKSLKS